jgi:hypothetical protein
MSGDGGGDGGDGGADAGADSGADAGADSGAGAEADAAASEADVDAAVESDDSVESEDLEDLEDLDEYAGAAGDGWGGDWEDSAQRLGGGDHSSRHGLDGGESEEKRDREAIADILRVDSGDADWLVRNLTSADLSAVLRRDGDAAERARRLLAASFFGFWGR